MSAGWGTGLREFIGYGATLTCTHCHNRVVEQVWATYSYEEAAFIRWKHFGERGSEECDGYIQFICGTCLNGVQFIGAEAAERKKKKVAKEEGGTAAAAFAIEVENRLKALTVRFDMNHTTQWFKTLNVLQKRGTLKVLNRVGLYELAAKLSGS
jgi:hypothetical protein